MRRLSITIPSKRGFLYIFSFFNQLIHSDCFIMNSKTAKKTALIVTSITNFMGPFMISSVNIALPAIQKEFSANAVLLSWIATSYLLSTAVFLIPIGKIADIYGRKKIFSNGILLFTLSSFFCAFSNSIYILIILRMIQGIGGAMFMTTAMAIVASIFPPQERGKAIGILVSAVYIGLSAGPFVGGIFTQYFGWRSIFIFHTPIGIFAYVLILIYIKGEWTDAREETFDLAGSILYGISLIALIYGTTLLPEKTGIVLFVFSIIGLIAFVRQELHCDYPVFEVKLFVENHVFAFSSIAALINYSATFAVTFLMSLYLQYIKSFPPQTAGLLLIAQPIMQAVFSPFAGNLSDRIEPFILASCGMALTAAGLFCCIFLGKNTGLFFILPTLILLGIGFGLFSSPNMNAIMSSVSKRLYGIASGTVATMRLLGQMISMAIATLVFSIIIGQQEINIETFDLFLKSLRIIFIVLFILCIMGIYFSMNRGKMRT